MNRQMVIVTKSGLVDTVPKGAVILLGYFDGFHIGHKVLAEAAYQIKTRKNAPCVVIWTFSHLSKGKAITDNDEKAEAFFSYSAAHDDSASAVVFEEFTRVSYLSGGDFVRDILYRQFAPCAVVCGFNFRFGKNGASGAAELLEYCKPFGIECCVVPPFTLDGNVVSSTAIRRLIASGDVFHAMAWMGRPYSVTAPVIHGKQIGHTLGFPTVNQRIPENKVFPAFGIYACRIKLPDGEMKNGVCNIGSRPTVNGDCSDITLETYIFDYHGDLYGKMVTVYFYKRLRNEMRFSSREELSEQIARDKEEAARFFDGGLN